MIELNNIFFFITNFFFLLSGTGLYFEITNTCFLCVLFFIDLNTDTEIRFGDDDE